MPHFLKAARLFGLSFLLATGSFVPAIAQDSRQEELNAEFMDVVRQRLPPEAVPALREKVRDGVAVLVDEGASDEEVEQAKANLERLLSMMVTTAMQDRRRPSVTVQRVEPRVTVPQGEAQVTVTQEEPKVTLTSSTP